MIEPDTTGVEPRQDLSRRWLASSLFFAAAVASLTAYYLWLYSDCLTKFFFLDDFWELREASSIDVRSPLDAWKFLRPVPFFLLYRPISTVAYFYAMRQLFDQDPTAYHATQLAFNVVNALLVYGIAGQLFRSRLLGLATAFVYAASPGHALAACWNASFTMTGTAFFYFSGLLVWLRARSKWRVPMTAALFVLALLASEHAITFPVTLTLVALAAEGQRDWRRLAREQAVFYAIAVVYGCIKLIYIRLLLAGIIAGMAAFAAGMTYALHFDPVLVLYNVGHFLDYVWSPLYARGLSEDSALLFAARSLSQDSALLFGTVYVGMAVVTTVLVLIGRWTALPLRVATVGIDLFVVALGPVALLRDHLVYYYVGIAGLGTSLAVVGLARAVPRVSMLVVGTAVATLVLTNALSSSTLARRSREFSTFDRHSERAEAWLYAITEAVRGQRVQEVVVPRDIFTEYLFEGGEAHRVLACARYRVRLSGGIEAEQFTPGSIVVRRPRSVPRSSAGGPERSWLRAACATERSRPAM